MQEVLVNRLGGLSLPRKSVVRLTDRPNMTLDVYRGRKTTKQEPAKNTSSGAANYKGNAETVSVHFRKKVILLRGYNIWNQKNCPEIRTLNLLLSHVY